MVHVLAHLTGVSAAPRLRESSCMLAPRRFTSRKFSWMRPSRLTRRLRTPVWTRCCCTMRPLEVRSCEATGVEASDARAPQARVADPQPGAEAVRSPARHAVRAEAQRPAPEGAADARCGAVGVHVRDGHFHLTVAAQLRQRRLGLDATLAKSNCSTRRR